MFSKKPLLVVLLALVLVILPLGLSPIAGQSDPALTFTVYGDSPVLVRGAAGEWDSGFILPSPIVVLDGILHIFYTAGQGDMRFEPFSVGYATSTDGYTWTKYDGNPVLQLDPSFAAYGVVLSVPLVQEGQWTLFIAPQYRPGLVYGLDIITATATDPQGPWEINYEPVLVAGSGRAWDGRGIGPMTAIQNGDTTHLYYAGFGGSGVQFGLATSTDGETWTAYHDPNNTAAAYRDSSPVFGGVDECGPDYINLPFVLQHHDTWLLFYNGFYEVETGVLAPRVCYATSADGITWERVGEAPVLGLPQPTDPVAQPIVVATEDTYFLYFSMALGDNTLPADIWLATAPVITD